MDALALLRWSIGTFVTSALVVSIHGLNMRGYVRSDFDMYEYLRKTDPVYSSQSKENTNIVELWKIEGEVVLPSLKNIYGKIESFESTEIEERLEIKTELVETGIEDIPEEKSVILGVEEESGDRDVELKDESPEKIDESPEKIEAPSAPVNLRVIR